MTDDEFYKIGTLLQKVRDRLDEIPSREDWYVGLAVFYSVAAVMVALALWFIS